MANTDKPKKKIMVKVPKDFELTKRYSDKKKEIVANTNSKNGDVIDNKAQGITIDKKSAVATPKQFRRKITTSSTNTKIIGTDGSVVYEGRNDSKATKEALKNSEKKTNITNTERQENANEYNRTGGSKTEFSEEDKATLNARKSGMYKE